MYLNPFFHHHKGTLKLPDFDLDCAPLPQRPAKIAASLAEEVRFRIPHIEMDREALEKFLPISNKGQNTNWLLPGMVSAELATYTADPRKLSNLADWAASLSGTEVLAGNGILNKPLELCEAVASR